MQRVCNIGLNFLSKSRIGRRYWFKIHRVVTNFKPITFIGKAQLLQDGGSYNDMSCYNDAESSLSFLMFQGNTLSYIVLY